MEVGKVIEDYRDYMGMSQKELADAIGVSRKTVSKWEMGAVFPRVEDLLALSEFFDVPVGDFLYDDIREIETTVAQNAHDLRIYYWTASGSLLFAIIVPIWGYLALRFPLLMSELLFVAAALVAFVAALRIIGLNRHDRMMRYSDALDMWEVGPDPDGALHRRNPSVPNAIIALIMSLVMIAGGSAFTVISLL